MQLYANTPAGPEAPPCRVFAGFWRRLIAFAVDAFISGLPCGILGFAFYSFFSTSGADGTLIGFALTVLYFGILGSYIGQGQTIGHRITHIQVINREGKFIPLDQSLVRYLILLGPILLSSELLPASEASVVKMSIDWLRFGAGFAIIYLYLFNRNTRQSLHDLATDTFVVAADGVRGVELPHFWAWHWPILGGTALMSAVLTIGIGHAVQRIGPFPELLAIQQAVLNSGKVQSVGVSAQKTLQGGNLGTGLIVNVVWRGTPPTTEEEATEVADIVMRADSHAADRNFIAVRFQEGFNIGFAMFSNSQQVSHDPETWVKQAQSYGLR